MTYRKSNFELPLVFEYRPPVELLQYIGVVHLITIISLFNNAVPAWMKGILGVGVIISYIYHHAHFQQAKNDPLVLMLDSGNSWKGQLKISHENQLQLKKCSFVHPKLIILQFTGEDIKKLTVMLTETNCDPVVHRRLRVRLRIQNSH